ncbi:RagB/SusD family nutrient uptake outer membrane protein [Phocaeicola plebeius]|uniref:RagB/SusD family nutrient uptake outer membrane protein n=1 Tax=Phocaeicola plebeius TaxID=310297 RepID=UPI0026EC0193|nr:RagB/SusD family nutrient uptake outer membrane protein [Phocaeicola plebeius]
MKKNLCLYMMAAAFLSGGLMSCNESDFLNLTDPNHFTEENFWKNKADAESALAAAYSPIKYQMNGYYGAFDGWLNLNSRGDDIFTILNEEPSMWDIATFQNSPTTGNDPYGALFAGVQRANIVLRYIDEIPASGISDEDRSMVKGEALFLRAYQYFLLVSNYKNVPLRLKPSNEEGTNIPSADEADVWTQIEQDLKDAISCNLPVTRQASEKGRVEKGAAIAVLAKVYLAQHKYEAAKEQLLLLIKPPYYGVRYKLMPNFADNFTTAKENNEESVFELQYSSDGDLTWGNESGINLGSSLPQFVGPAVSGGWAKLMPSAFLVSEFTKEPRASEKTEGGPDSKYDKRMYASLFFTPSDLGDWVVDNDWYSSIYYGGNYTMDQLWNGNSAKMAGGAPIFVVPGVSGNLKFLLKKYTAYFVNSKTADSMADKEGKANNVRVMRFAEVLLMYAEACAKTNDAGQANWALTEIRNRAGLPEKTFDLSNLMGEIEHQCLLEFFGEGHRFDDLKRWYTTAEIQMKFRDHQKQGAENFKEKHKYYPIPSGELNNNTAMKQNELWQ